MRSFYAPRSGAFPTFISSARAASFRGYSRRASWCTTGARQVSRRTCSIAPSSTTVRSDEWIDRAVEQMKSTVRPFFRERYLSAKHMRAAFYGFDRHAIGERIALMEKIVGKRVDLTWHSPNLMEIRAS